MQDSVNGPGADPTEADATTRPSRRRPGRRDDVHPALIPLLRGTASPVPDEFPAIVPPPQHHADPETADDGLNPARGIIFGVALSVPIWAILVLAACSLLSVKAVEIALAVPLGVALGLAIWHLLD